MNAEQLESVYMQTKDHVMILEQYIDGDVFTLDGICDENGDIRYLNSLEYVGNCMVLCFTNKVLVVIQLLYQ